MDTNGIFPSTMGDLQVTSGDVDSLVQVVSQAENSSFQELFPSSQVPLECCTCMMLYWISLKSESSKLHQASKLEFCVVGVFFFFDDCWILTGQLWDVGWLWWLNWKSHTMPTIPWVSSEFLQVYHHFREFRYSLFQESVAAESNSSDIFHESCSVWFFHVFSMTRTAPFFSPWLFWWPSLRFRAPILMEVSWVMGVAPNHPSHSTISVLKPMVTWGSSILWNPYICIIYYNIL